ncbi:MAG: hypothetical protein IKX79_02980, partial [Desulfovibrionaceae bacterium]|nr:hypothetical protein [Desulfovibrionaceae bacterium]
MPALRRAFLFLIWNAENGNQAAFPAWKRGNALSGMELFAFCCRMAEECALKVPGKAFFRVKWERDACR